MPAMIVPAMTKPPTLMSSQRKMFGYSQTEVDEHDLHEQRRSAEDPDIEVGRPPEGAVARDATERTENAQHDAQELRRDRDGDGQDEAMDDPRVGSEK